MAHPPLIAAAAYGLGYRAVTAHDGDFLQRLYATTREVEMHATGWPPAIKAVFLAQQFTAQRADYDANYPGAERLIVVRGVEDIGRLYIDLSGADYLLIDISLLPHARGGGLGTAILRDVQSHAATLDKPVSLHVAHDNNARNLYERLGFAVTAPGDAYDQMIWRPRSL